MPIFSNKLSIVVGLALLFEFLNGMRDASNIVATMIYSRAFHPRVALLITAVAEFVGPFLFGVVVAKTIGGGIVDSHLVRLNTVIACLVGAIVWNLTTWFFGLPSSSSHALLGGLIGAIIMSAGVSSLKWGGLNTVLLGLIISPLFGFLVGFILLRIIYFLAQRATPAINVFFKRGQIITAIGLGLGHGTNHAQKTTGGDCTQPCHRRRDRWICSSHVGDCFNCSGVGCWHWRWRVAVDPHFGWQVLQSETCA